MEIIHDSAADLSVLNGKTIAVRYLPDLYLPDKAIDLIDESAARVRMEEAAGGRGGALSVLSFWLQLLWDRRG